MNTLLEYYEYMVAALKAGRDQHMKICLHCGQPMVGSTPAGEASVSLQSTLEVLPPCGICDKPMAECACGSWRDRSPLL